MTKVKVLQPFVQGKKSFGVNDELSLTQEVAYSLALKGVVEFKNKKEFTTLDENTKAEEKEKQEQKEEEERQAAAILEKDFLENKRATLQSEVDAITHILDDAATYYKPYFDLAEDLAKKEAEDLAKKEAEDLAKKQGDQEK